MEKTLMRAQATDRIAVTLLRLCWLCAAFSIAANLLNLAEVIGTAVVVFSVLIWFCLIIISFGMLLLKENFRNFLKDPNGFFEMIESVRQVFLQVLPAVMAVGAVLGVACILLSALRPGVTSSRSRIISAVFALVFLLGCGALFLSAAAA